MRVKTLLLTPQLLVAMLQSCKDGPPRRFIVKANALPDDATLVAVLQAEPTRITSDLVLWISSETFPEVTGQTPALEPPIFETVFDESDAGVATPDKLLFLPERLTKELKE